MGNEWRIVGRATLWERDEFVGSWGPAGTSEGEDADPGTDQVGCVSCGFLRAMTKRLYMLKGENVQHR